MYVLICNHIYMYVWVHAYISYMFICMFECMHIYLYVCVSACIYIYMTHTWRCVCPAYAYTCICIRIYLHACIQTRMRAYKHACARARAHSFPLIGNTLATPYDTLATHWQHGYHIGTYRAHSFPQALPVCVSAREESRWRSSVANVMPVLPMCC
jgi:hypothetical protein